MSFREPLLTVDVIVVGYGAAGASAALTAHEHGAETIILEKMPRAGGNSLVSSANMVFPQNPALADKFADYLNEVNFGTTERELVDTFVEELLENPAWLESLGGELEIYLTFHGMWKKLVGSRRYAANQPRRERGFKGKVIAGGSEWHRIK